MFKVVDFGVLGEVSVKFGSEDFYGYVLEDIV